MTAPAAADPRPVLWVTNHAPSYRVGAFARLHADEGVCFALVGGAVRHGGGAGETRALPFPVLRCPQPAVLRLAASGRFRAVVAGAERPRGSGRRLGGARAAEVPFVLWATMWAHPRTAAHALSYLPVRHLYRHADAVVTYGPHVSRYVRSKGARATVVEAPQSVDGAFWSAATWPRRHAPFQVLFSGRVQAEKGVDTLVRAWRETGLRPPSASLVVAGAGPLEAAVRACGGLVLGWSPPEEVRALYAGSDVVVLPSIPTRAFLEPWGLAVNEAFHQGVPVNRHRRRRRGGRRSRPPRADRPRGARRGRRRAGQRPAAPGRRPVPARAARAGGAPSGERLLARGLESGSSRALAAVSASRRVVP